MKHVIDEETGTDFGVDVDGLRNKIDLWEAPIEAIDNRPDPAVVKRLNTVSLKEVTKSDGSALRAAKAEVVEEKSYSEEEKSDGIEFKFEGDSYTIPPFDKWPLEVFEAGEDGNLVTPVRELLGPEQWAFFKNKKQRTLIDLDALFDAAQNAGGAKPGESDA